MIEQLLIFSRNFPPFIKRYISEKREKQVSKNSRKVGKKENTRGADKFLAL
jgi:hypothetical protein